MGLSLPNPFKVAKKAVKTVTGVLEGATNVAKNIVKGGGGTTYETLAGVNEAKKEGFIHTNPGRIIMTEEEELPLLGSADKPKQG